ncbi:MAG: hypothetical protein JXB18_03935 [Sedimentisphaerales bacterium]|nr:hypothetical protein [Sedimentisphaerales bacterium]
MVNKPRIVGIAFVLLLILAFLTGLYKLKQFGASLTLPQIESETSARQKISSHFRLPENATNLYYARRGFVDADHYMAFSLPDRQACDHFINDAMNKELTDFVETSELPEEFKEHGPDTWPEPFRDTRWDLSPGSRHLLAFSSYTIIYTPEKNRFYCHHR